MSNNDTDREDALERIEMAMGALFENRASAERHLQHAHVSLGGEKDDLYQYVDTNTERGDE